MPNKSTISQETQVVFTIKSFIATIGTILGLFIGFYTLVIQPKFTSHETRMEKILDKVDVGFDNVNIQLMEMNNGIGALNGHVEGINNRFRDLNKSREVSGANEGGFGNH